MYKVTLRSFSSDKSASLKKVLRDQLGMGLPEIRHVLDNLPWVMFDPWVPGEEPARDELLDLIRDFDLADIVTTPWSEP